MNRNVQAIYWQVFAPSVNQLYAKQQHHAVDICTSLASVDNTLLIECLVAFACDKR